MMLVKTKLAPSPIHGMGVFAEEFIPKGTKVWTFEPEFDRELSLEQAKNLPEHIQNWLEHFAYVDISTKSWIICVDDARFVNHSSDPNIKPDYSKDPYGPDIACRDIHPGEEITDDYTLFEDKPPPA